MFRNSYTGHLSGLREKIKIYKAAGILIPQADRFQNEYIQSSDNYLEWLTGFTGSAGLAIVLKDKAALFVDGRYTLQAADQVNINDFSIEPYTLLSIIQWLTTNCINNKSILYDPWLHTIQQIEGYNISLQTIDLTLKPCIPNFLEELAIDRPPYQFSAFEVHDEQWAGETTKNKLQIFLDNLLKRDGDSFIITYPQSISWTLNIRCESAHHNPACSSYMIINKDGLIAAFAPLLNVTDRLKQHCGKQVSWYDIKDFEGYLENLRGKKVILDPALVPNQIFLVLKKLQSTIIYTTDPSILARAVKNKIEQRGMENAHKKDGVAVINFLSWLDKEVHARPIYELEAADYLLKERQKQLDFRDESFAIVSAAGAHGAIVHYKPTLATNAFVKPNMLYLVDSGGHYNNGTTDVTRTVAVGEPTLEQKDHFTRVLKGHIALAQAIFPIGTTGHQLDILARQFLWQVGLDYDHGTGHGVGSYLNVHEGPHQISKRLNTTPLQPGMVVTNEPGYYKKDEYGIRIENIMLVESVQVEKEREVLGFKTLTLVPIDHRLIKFSLLNESERQWLNDYHKRIYDELHDQVDEEAKIWLFEATKKL